MHQIGYRLVYESTQRSHTKNVFQLKIKCHFNQLVETIIFVFEGFIDNNTFKIVMDCFFNIINVLGMTYKRYITGKKEYFYHLIQIIYFL